MSEPSYIEGVDVNTFTSFEVEGYTDEEALVLAQGLLERAVPCLATIYPTLSAAERMVAKFAVLEMAKYIKIDYYHFERATSPFQSETIGSYTYNKMARSIQTSTETGVPGFDRAVSDLGALCEMAGDGGSGATSEQVFKPGYTSFIERREHGVQPVSPRIPYTWARGPY